MLKELDLGFFLIKNVPQFFVCHTLLFSSDFGFDKPFRIYEE